MLPPNPEITLRLIEADAELRRTRAARARMAQAAADQAEALRELPPPMGRRGRTRRAFLRVIQALNP